MKKICFTDVYKSYNDNQILSAINFQVEVGECFVIVGPSGSGKSTILNLIAGLTKPERGTIEVKSNVSLVFQNFALYPHMNVYNNIAFALKSKKLTKKEIETRVQSVVKKLHIEQLLKRKPKELSGGEKQRVALARALATEAEIILMDEPLSSLDADLRIKLREELKNFHKENNTTLVFVTHDQTEAMTLADRIFILKEGHIEQIGTPKEIYEKPKTPFVGKFIGIPTINFFKDKKGNLLGIRPHHVSISEIGEKVTIDSIDYLGNENWVHFKYNNFPFILTTERMDLKIDEEISIIFDEEQIVKF